jgi:hydrogenase maturation protein HypF
MPRRIITVSGIVQGVGFRPFVHEIACRLGLAGLVRNQGGSAVIEVEGTDSTLDRFLVELTHQPPPPAQIECVSWRRAVERGEAQFRIESSGLGGCESVSIAPDIATCDECLAELFDPAIALSTALGARIAARG